MPRGVDLNLDKFNLSAVAQAGSWAGTLEAPEGSEHLAVGGKSFWKSLEEGPASGFQEEDRSLLASVYNPNLADRREDGEFFMPPPTGLTYMHRLKTLVTEEAVVQETRREHFLSGDFVMDNAGSLFPSSWTSSIELERDAASAVKLTPCPVVLTSATADLQEVLDSSVPVFDKCTEDGARFLVYRLGSLEIRATQRPHGERSIGAVFSMGAAVTLQAGDNQALDDVEKLAKVAEYVEAAPSGKLQCRFYVVFTMESGRQISTEQLSDGSIEWCEDSEALQARNSLAKVLATAACCGTVGDVRAKGAQLMVRACGKVASPSQCKRYAAVIYQCLASSQA